MTGQYITQNNEAGRRNYSEDEVATLYELGRFLSENGDFGRAEIVLQGLVEVAPDYAPAWLGLCYIYFQRQAWEHAVQAAKRAQKLDSRLPAAQLYLAAGLMLTGDFTSAGTLLGEVGERIADGEIKDPSTIRFHKLQIARFETTHKA